MRRKGKFLCNLDQSLLVLFFIGIVYSLFPSINNTNDAYMYAAEYERESICFILIIYYIMYWVMFVANYFIYMIRYLFYAY